MKKSIITNLALGLTILLCIGSVAYAESSGNFSSGVNTTKCLIDNAAGTLTGGIGDTFLQTTLRTPNYQWTALVILPSLVTGLFTKNRVDTTTTQSTAYVGVKVRVLIDNKVVAPGTPIGADVKIPANADAGWVYYDKRWQQVIANLFNQIAACVTAPTICNLELILSTLSAHSMDIVVGDVGGGDHTLKVEWQFEDSDGNLGNAAACVDPGILTVQQVKTFQTGGGIEILPLP